MSKSQVNRALVAWLFIAAGAAIASPAYALDGGPLQMIPRNGWKAFEVISVGNNPASDGINYAMPGTFDGLGAWRSNDSNLSVPVNHETGDASISEVNLNLSSFRAAIGNMITGGSTGGVSFVTSAQQAYDRWTNDGGATWIDTADATTTTFSRFCSGQSYEPGAFGPDRGFVDNIYITGEEGGTNRLFALDLANRDFYRLSGVAGAASGGLGGMPFDAWENAALLDTGETNHVALLLSPDGGTSRMQLYIGEKGKGTTGAVASDFLARNGLAYGSYYYLNDTLPANGTSLDGTIDATAAGALTSTKLEDVDTSPSDPTQVVLGDEDSGVFTFDFNLDFSGGNFNAASSGFSIAKIHNHINDLDGALGDADNVDWTDATVLNGVSYPSGIIFVNEDSGTANGETWMSRPDGSGLTLIADNVGIGTATESTGILDISQLVGYRPGSILLTANQGSIASITVLINPQATALPHLSGDFDENGVVDLADLTKWRVGFGTTGTATHMDGDADADGDVDGGDFLEWQQQLGSEPALVASESVPEPCAIVLVSLAGCGLALLRTRHRYAAQEWLVAGKPRRPKWASRVTRSLR
ncbi:MAG: hypothetical protein H0T51_19545 [Pirellulales bacterium]|nr:hypothetical protein [Pirellulales bacterium]